MDGSEENTEQKVKVTPFSFAAEFGDEHEPPIGSGGCSFFFDIPDAFFSLGAPITVGNFKKYNFMTLTGTIYNAISDVAIMTENRIINQGISFVKFELAEEQEAKLRIWLSDSRDEPANPEPDVIIDGAGGGSIMIKALLNESDLRKINRRKRHSHPVSNLSAVKWELLDRNGTPLINPNGTPCRASRDDLYYFYISFHHRPITG